MARILLVGHSGQVGWELERSLLGLGEVTAPGRSRLDLNDAGQIADFVRECAPAIVVNAAAYTDVEGAEGDEAAAFAINAGAVAALAAAARDCGAALVHYSTDYVFDGEQMQPYREGDPTAPLSVYGRSKLAGEQAIRAAGCAHLVLRTSWVYAARGRNFLRTIVRLAGHRPQLRIVNDQFGAPTSARLIAQVTALMIHSYLTDAGARTRVGAGTTVHLTAGGETTWFGFACRARELAHELGVAFTADLLPIAAAEYPTKARRPRNSRLSLERLQRDWGIAVPSWEAGLRLCMEELAAARTGAGA